MAKSKHIHKYIRSKLGKKIIFKCSWPGCSHYIFEDLIEGKFSICWRCGDPFPIGKVAATLKKPHCLSCTHSKKKEDVSKIKDILGDDLMKILED